MKTVSRRQFIQLTSSSIVITSGFGQLSACAQESRTPLGIQLYTLRDAMANDVSSVLRTLAKIGYKEVEFAGYFDHSAVDLLAMLKENSLSAPAAHVLYESMDSNLESVIEYGQMMGHKYLVVPYLNEDVRQSVDDYLLHAENFNIWGEHCSKAGMQLCYHNHDFEFSAIDGRIPYDILLQNTDPGLVAMEMDLYWICKAGASASNYFAAYPGRFPLWHLKDMGESGAIVDVGDGVIDFPSILAQRELAGLRHGFVEHDDPSDSLQSARSSFQYLANRW